MCGSSRGTAAFSSLLRRQNFQAHRESTPGNAYVVPGPPQCTAGILPALSASPASEIAPSGHGFSRAETRVLNERALAPEADVARLFRGGDAPNKTNNWPSHRAPKIVHVDVDAFFASVEQALDPRLRGKPVLVGRGVVASASYEAKARGVRTAMSFRDALRLCPKAIVVPGQYEHYADYAARVQRILVDFTPAVECAALDDFYLDFTGTDRLYPDFPGTLRRMQQRVEAELGISVSLGAATTKLVASVASRLQRPRGFGIVPPGTEEEFLAPLPVEKLHGIGHVHAQTLRERGVTTIGELRRVPVVALVATFGEVVGRQIAERARGLDDRSVHLPPEPKSISRETTIEGGTIDLEFLSALTEYLAERVGTTLREHHRQARSLALRLRYTDFLSAARSTRLTPATNDEKSLHAAAMELFRALYTRRVALRFVGVSVTNLEPERRQNNLFDAESNRRWYLHRGVDLVRHRFGWNSLFYGKGLELREHYATKPNGLVLSTPCLSR